MEQGKGSGSIQIPPSLDSDNYTVRAYTSWMKNFSSDFYFHQTISIVNTFQRLVEKNKNTINRYDIQFFPEGGHLVDGVTSRVAFRVIDSSGKGISFKGAVVNKKGDTLTTFTPLKFGMGCFSFTPSITEEYHAVIMDKNRNKITSPLSDVSSIGYVLSVTDTTQHQLKVTITSKGFGNASSVFLIAHTRQIVKKSIVQNMVNGKTVVMLNKKELGDGIVHFTVFNQDQQPVCERLYFNQPAQTTSLHLTTELPIYETRKKVSLQATIKSDKTQLIQASLSVYKNDSLQQLQPADIQSYLWLTSELKGNIESPAYYFSDDKEARSAMDHLMLTHGWSKFNWNDVLQSQRKVIQFIPEYRGHIIQGKVIDGQSRDPLNKVSVYLSSPDKKIQPYFAHSDSNGRFLLETFHITGNRKLIVQTPNQSGKAHIEIESPFSSEATSTAIPYLDLTDQVKTSLSQRSISMQAEDIFYQGRVKTNTLNTDSSAFYGSVHEHYQLDDYTRFPLMEEVMREYVKGVQVRKKEDKIILKVLDAPRNTVFENDPLILLDGVPVLNGSKIMEIDPLKIKTIDVVTHHYFSGEFSFDGIISLKTYAADMDGFQLDPNHIVLDYYGLQQKKEFYAPRYETPAARQSRLPDQRNLLLWLPDLTLHKENQSIEFYSSDQAGVFQIVIQGISQNGEPIYQTHSFEVKSTQH